jgi:regulator of protease activity HflC (stomatin/prohibitin superfamily)
MYKSTFTKWFTITLLIIGLVVVSALGNQIVETVPAGFYIIKQAAVSGRLTPHMEPGMFMQNFGDVHLWPKAETFYFTADPHEGDPSDQSIMVRFVDGSKANISGSVRVNYPTIGEKAIDLTTVHGFRSPKAVMEEAVKKHVRNCFNLAANMMTATESYKEKRAEFISSTEDMLRSGIYVTYEEDRTTTDPLTNKLITTRVRVPRHDDKGLILRIEVSPIEKIGIGLSNFEIKSIIYEDRVEKQIAQQQDAYMAVATAKANAEKAKQEALTKEQEGLANVMQAKYEKEKDKAQAKVTAEQQREVAEIEAQKQVAVAEFAKKQAEIVANQGLEVAKIAKQEADVKAQAVLVTAEADSKARRLVLEADGALKQKLEAYTAVQKLWADAFSKRAVPSIIVGGATGGNGSNTDQQSIDLSAALGLRVLNDMGLDLNIAKNSAPATQQ